MSLARRGLMRLFGAGAAAAAAPAASVGDGLALPFHPSIGSTGIVSGAGPISSGQPGPEQYKLWELTRRPHERKQRKRQLEAALNAGWPPHIASCHSWAPWFKAQRAAAHIEQQEDAANDFFTALRKRIMGDDW